MNQHKNTDLQTGARATFCCLLGTSPVILSETASALVPVEPLACPCGHRAQEHQPNPAWAGRRGSGGLPASALPVAAPVSIHGPPRPGIVPSPVSPPPAPVPIPLCPHLPHTGLRPRGCFLPDPSPWSQGPSCPPCPAPSLGWEMFLQGQGPFPAALAAQRAQRIPWIEASLPLAHGGDTEAQPERPRGCHSLPPWVPEGTGSAGPALPGPGPGSAAQAGGAWLVPGLGWGSLTTNRFHLEQAVGGQVHNHPCRSFKMCL